MASNQMSLRQDHLLNSHQILLNHLAKQKQNLLDEGIFESEEYRTLFCETRLDFTINMAKSILFPILTGYIRNIEDYLPMILPVPDGSFDINWSLKVSALIIHISNEISESIEITGIDKKNSNNLLQQRDEDREYIVLVAQLWIQRYISQN